MCNNHKAIENPENTCFNCLKEGEVTKIHISEMGYGSSFDGWSTEIYLCESCLKQTNSEWWQLEVIQCEWDKENSNHGFTEYKYEKEILEYVSKMSIKGRELFWNRYSTDNHRMEPQDWIDYELGILPHEKCKEYGYYSPNEIKAYQDRFPVCQHPVNRVWNDNSKGCWCPFGASGEYGQKINEYNISEECYQCHYFKERTIPIIDIPNEDYDDYKLWYK